MLAKVLKQSGAAFLLTICVTTQSGWGQIKPHTVKNPFSISINFSGDQSYLQYFQEAVDVWQEVIPGYLDGDTLSGAASDIAITVLMDTIDGPGGIIGSAGPRNAIRDLSGHILPTTGEMIFDTADFDQLPEAYLAPTILHEMGHVIGLGTLWQAAGLYDPDAEPGVNPFTGEPAGRYTGYFGLEGFRDEYGLWDAEYVPVELGGGLGTRDAHWDEIDFGEGWATPSAQSATSGLDMTNELMTGWLNSGGAFISNVSRGSLRDLGYDVQFMTNPIPEPSSALLALLGFLPLLTRRRRK